MPPIHRFSAVAAVGNELESIQASVRGLRRQLDANLARCVMPFWTRDTCDQQYGGFFTRLDRYGHPLKSADKCLVSQAGMIWSLAAGHRHGLHESPYLDLAAQGVRFLVDRMWDVTHGGFVWKVSREGRFVDTRKDLLGQAVAVYALVEFANASGDVAPRSTAAALFELIEKKAADQRGGYCEHFTQAWDRAAGALSKTLLTHMHVMLAFTALAQASGDPVHREAVSRVMTVLHDRAVDPIHHAAAESFDDSWRRAWSLRPRATWYGLNATLAWQLLAAADCVGARERVRNGVLGLVDHTLKYGFDRARGGIARYGPIRGHVARAIFFHPRRLTKLWWAQAEFLVAALEAYRMTSAPEYLDAFRKQFDWIWSRQIDQQSGVWHDATTWRGRPLTSAGHDDWRNPFHEVRALTRVSTALSAMNV